MINKLKILQESQNLVQNEYNKFVKDTDYTIGQYTNTAPKEHSEKPLVLLLQEKKYIKNMVLCLKSKVVKLYPNYNPLDGQKFKVYAVNLFINSENNVCDTCEEKLYNLMQPQEGNSFLCILKNELCNVNGQMFETVKKNNGFPYMSISVSAFRLSYSKLTTLKDDALQALSKLNSIDKKFLDLSLDIKEISGKLILSTAEWWLYGQSKKEYLEYIGGICNSNTKLPFYSGFKSGRYAEYSKDNLNYDTPYCHDGINILGITPDTEPTTQI